jgi:hypothetical protein
MELFGEKKEDESLWVTILRFPLSKNIENINHRIRKFLILLRNEGCNFLGCRGAGFDTPWNISSRGNIPLEKGRTFYSSNEV